MLVADTLTADLTFYANGERRDRAAGPRAAMRGVTEGDMTRYALPRREPLVRRARGVLRPASRGERDPPS